MGNNPTRYEAELTASHSQHLVAYQKTIFLKSTPAKIFSFFSKNFCGITMLIP
jgi:hypothetical protein